MAQAKTRRWRLNEQAEGVSCAVCGKEQAVVTQVGIKEDPEEPVFLCRACGVWFIRNRMGDLREYYRGAYRVAHDGVVPTEEGARTPEGRYQSQFSANASAAKDFREAVAPGGTVLDIGCSAGGFLGHIYKDYECYGLEWNPEDAAYVRDVGEMPCEESSLEEAYAGKTFSAIVALHVLEHQEQPVEFLRQCRDRLIGGGALFLEVPNLSNAFISIYNIPTFRRVWFTEPHLTYWTPEVLGGLIATMGFDARLWTKNRTGILTALHWLYEPSPTMPFGFSSVLAPVAKNHPTAALMNRLWGKLDWEYRLQMENLRVGDVIRVLGRRGQI